MGGIFKKISTNIYRLEWQNIYALYAGISMTQMI